MDTCAALWVMDGSLPESAAGVLHHAEVIGVSPITAWEVSLLVSKHRLAVSLSTKTWFDRLVGIEGVRLLALSPDILITANELPGNLHRDPADRILAATARTAGYRLMTRDRPLLAYAEAGHLDAIAC